MWYMLQRKENTRLFLKEYGKAVILSVVFVCICTSSLLLLEELLPKKMKVVFLDVGQGDAIFIETPSGKQMLIDGGRNESVRRKVAELLPFNDRSLDVVVATHDDSDHITGLVDVLTYYTVEHIVTSSLRGESDVAKQLHERIEEKTKSGGQLHIGVLGNLIDFQDGVQVKVLYPRSGEVHGDTNDSSLVFMITYGEHSILLTGDLSQSFETKLLQHVPKNSLTIYKAGHHGSNTSSGEVLLSKIQPEYAVISAGKDNSYGHPHKETIERLEKYSKEILSTIEKGSITFVSDGKTLEVTTKK